MCASCVCSCACVSVPPSGVRCLPWFSPRCRRLFFPVLRMLIQNRKSDFFTTNFHMLSLAHVRRLPVPRRLFFLTGIYFKCLIFGLGGQEGRLCCLVSVSWPLLGLLVSADPSCRLRGPTSHLPLGRNLTRLTSVGRGGRVEYG